MRAQPVLQRFVHAGLPAGPARPEFGKHIIYQAGACPGAGRRNMSVKGCIGEG